MSNISATYLSHSWNAFKSAERLWSNKNYNRQLGMLTTRRPDRNLLRMGTERTILASVYTRIAIDVASIEIRHARVDQNGQFIEEIKSPLNECLSISPNKDQTARAFLMDAVLTMFEEGYMAIAPIDTSTDIDLGSSWDIHSLRIGRITGWMPAHVKVECYDERDGIRKEITFSKDKVCIVENPFYQVMNEPNSTLQRLKHKLSLLDATDDKQNSDKLNMIIQLPYTIKGESRMKQAEERRKQVEFQLTESKYGVAYIDSTEKIVQLGHPIENRLIEQIDYFTNQLYAQLGLTPEVFNGTASPQVMLNYNNRTLETIISAIVDEMNRKFLTKTARTQGQAIVFFKSPFSLVTVDNLAEIADKFTRNEVISSNELRAVLGYRPVDTPRADELINKNINPISEDPSMMPGMMPEEDGIDSMMDPNIQNGNLDVSDMSPDEIQEYITKLESYQMELDELDEQVDST